MRPLVRLLSLIAILALPSVASAADEPPPVSRRILDQLAKPILGVWVSDAEPLGYLRIDSWGSGAIGISGSERYEAVGFYDGSEMVGVTRTPARPKSDARSNRIGVVRLRSREDGRIEASFSADLASSPSRRETWTRKGWFGDAPAPAPQDHGDELPKFGEYVYVEELPEAVEKVPPAYPEWARQKNVEGTVLVQALVGRDGRIKDTKIVKSIPELDDYAVAAVRQWRFKPATAKGSPVAVWVAIPVKFSLH